MTGPRSLGAAALAALAGLTACSAHSGHRGLPAAQVSQRYEVAMGPANSAIASFVTQAVAVSGGAPGALTTAARQTATVVHRASDQVHGIPTAEPIQRDLNDVVSSLTALVSDLTTLSSARGGDLPPAVARVVADAGREAAADQLVKLALIAATTPTTPPPVTVAPDTTVVAETTTTKVPATTTPRRTTTTRPRTTTSVARTTTTTTIKH